MTGKSPERPRDGWAAAGTRLHVANAPADAINLNVEGRGMVGPLQGFGQLWQKTYRVSLAGADVTPEQVIDLWKRELASLQPPENRFFPSVEGIRPGEAVLINARTPAGLVSTGVLVLYADSESFSLMTPEGHPESGWVTFSAFVDASGTTVAQVQSMARANDPFYELAFRIVGSKMQERIWRHVLAGLAQRFGVVAEPTLSKTLVDPRVQWSQARNLWKNAAVRTVLYSATQPLRRRPRT